MDRLIAAVAAALLLVLCGIYGCSRLQTKRVSSMEIWKAVEREDLDAIEAYANNGGDLEVGAKSIGKTPLLHALILKKRKSYSKLLSLGASANTECRGGHEILPPRTPVIHHAAREKDPFWLREALEAGGDPNLMNNAEDLSKGTPLLFAILRRGGGIENVKLLCKHGADINAPCEYRGQTPLRIACGQGRFETVHYLLEQGANPLDAGPGDKSLTFMDCIRQSAYGPDAYGTAEEHKWCEAVWDWLSSRGMDPAKAKWNGSKWTWD